MASFDDNESLYCDEESEVCFNKNNSLLSLLGQDLLWDDEELKSLLAKETETQTSLKPNTKIESFSFSRKEAIEWILKINSHYGFSTLTAILAVNYLDRFICSTLYFEKEKMPWMLQLVSVACLSLAAKVEETYVPLLLDLQVEGAGYVFEAKTIQRMELLVLSTLKWRMNPVTPLSFLDHIIRRLGLTTYIHWEFLHSCENLLLSVVSDSRVLRYLPSVLATSTMLHIIHQLESCNDATQYENQLLDLIKINKDEVDECCELISDVVTTSGFIGKINTLKRKFRADDQVFDSFLSSDSSNESWCMCSSNNDQHIFKKIRVEEQRMKLPSIIRRVFVDIIGSPR